MEGPMLPFLHMADAMSSPPCRDIKRLRLIASALLLFDVFTNSSLVTFWDSTWGRKKGDSNALPVMVIPVAQRRGMALSSKLVRSWRASMRPKSSFLPNFSKAGPLRDFSSASRFLAPGSCFRTLTDSRMSNLDWLASFWDLSTLATRKGIYWFWRGRLEVLSSLLLRTHILAFANKSLHTLTSWTQWHCIEQGGVWTWVDFQKGSYSAIFNGCENATCVRFAKTSRVLPFFPGDKLLYLSLCNHRPPPLVELTGSIALGTSIAHLFHILELLHVVDKGLRFLALTSLEHASVILA